MVLPRVTLATDVTVDVTRDVDGIHSVDTEQHPNLLSGAIIRRKNSVLRSLVDLHIADHQNVDFLTADITYLPILPYPNPTSPNLA
jgi:hypothetical protein